MIIPVAHGHLEANLREAEGEIRGAAVLCHPHPVYGGTMHTKAVYRTAQALNEAGVSVLRFNFRGVGTSTGSFDEGHGEQEDARDALDFLAGILPDVPVILAGFSFGAMIALSVGLEDARVVGLVGLGIPLGLYDFSFLAEATKPVLLVQGDDDEFGFGSLVEETVVPLSDSITLRRIANSDHYFEGWHEELKEAVRSYFTAGPGAALLAPVPSGS